MTKVEPNKLKNPSQNSFLAVVAGVGRRVIEDRRHPQLGSAGDLAGYGQIVTRTGPGDGPLHHLLRVYLIDRRGRVRNIYGLEFLDPRLLLADIRTLLLEERAEGH